MNDPAPSIEDWLQRLTGAQLPAFARTAQRIAGKTLDTDSSAAELAALILQDVSLTARLLRMANGALFNPGGGRISTISRAIIVLGFDTVRDLSLSIAVVDGLLVGDNRALVAGEMGRALHAALQARQLARQARLAQAEEIFVAALLSHLGELSLMCAIGAHEQRLIAPLLASRRLPAAQRSRAESELLGFPLRELTLRLNREWRLSELLNRTLEGRDAADLRSQVVRFGDELADCLAREGPGPAMDALLAATGKSLRLEPRSLREETLSTLASAAEMAQALGASTSFAEPPAVANAARPAKPASAADPVAAPAADPGLGTEGDPALQLAVLRELSQLLAEHSPSVGALMDLVLEGLFRGVGFDRVVFALLSPDRQTLRAKSVLHGEGSELPRPFEFAARPASANALSWVLAQGEPQWLGGTQDPAGLPDDPALAALCGGRCLLMPLSVGQVQIGCLYADRARSGRGLDADIYAGFRLFGQQALLGLALIKQGKG